MGWVKLDDGFFQHPKVVRVSRDAKALYLAGLCYSGAQLTDGFIPTEALKIMAAGAEITGAPKAAKQLVDVGLWGQTEGGFMVHNYLDYNQSAEKVHANRDAARDRMQRGRSREQSRTEPDRSQNVRANNERSSRDVREPDRDTDTDADTPSSEGERAAQAPTHPHPDSKSSSSRGNRLPASFAVSEDMRVWARDQGADDALIGRETEKFCDYWRSEAGPKTTKRDWIGAWRNWMRRALERGGSPDNLRSIADRRAGSRSIITPDMTEADILGSYPAERTRV